MDNITPLLQALTTQPAYALVAVLGMVLLENWVSLKHWHHAFSLFHLLLDRMLGRDGPWRRQPEQQHLQVLEQQERHLPLLANGPAVAVLQGASHLNRRMITATLLSEPGVRLEVSLQLVIIVPNVAISGDKIYITIPGHVSVERHIRPGESIKVMVRREKRSRGDKG